MAGWAFPGGEMGTSGTSRGARVPTFDLVVRGGTVVDGTGGAARTADVAVNDCRGRQIFAGRTDAQGLARIGTALAPQPRDCLVDQGYFVTARKAIAESHRQATTLELVPE